MFLVQAIADFEPEMALQSYGQDKADSKGQKAESDQIDNASKQQMEERLLEKGEQHTVQRDQEPHSAEAGDSKHQQQEPNAQEAEEEPEGNKRKRSADHEEQLQQAQQTQSIVYLSFHKGDKIVTRQTFDNGWWYGNVLKKPDVMGYFPSNYVKVGTAAPLPQMPPEPEDKEDWMKQELKKLGGPVKSDYYQGITGYKMVKIDDKNKNILKGNYVKYDAASGLAKVPIKSQDPAAKAVRQMGYYFDYHEWCEHKNANPTPKSRPDPRKKPKKRLNLILFGEDKIKRKPRNE